jgi:hypothetical protein
MKTSGPGAVHELGGGFGLVWYPAVEVDDDELDALVHLKLGVDHNRLVVDQFTARRRQGGPPVTIDTLKSMPMVRLAAAPAIDMGIEGGLVRLGTPGSGTLGPNDCATPVDVDALDELPELDRVALVYRWGYFVGFAPTSVVAETLELSRSVAAKRVQAARRAGLLPPTARGQKGA